MSIQLAFAQMDHIFAAAKQHGDATAINDIIPLPSGAVSSQETRLYVKDLLTRNIDSRSGKIVPTCACSVTTGYGNVMVRCPKCYTMCTTNNATTSNIRLWIRKPEAVVAFIAPDMVSMLSDRFSKPKFNVIHWLMDSRQLVTGVLPDYAAQLLDTDITIRDVHGRSSSGKIERGYNFFVLNMLEILKVLYSMPAFAKKTKKSEPDQLALLINDSIDKVFSHHLPIIPKNMLPVETASVGSYVDPGTPLIVDALLTIIYPVVNGVPLTQVKTESMVARYLIKMSIGLATYFKEVVYGKLGAMKRSLFGTKGIFISRRVIVPMIGHHQHDELEIPWVDGLVLLELHLKNKLFQRYPGLTDAEATYIIKSCRMRYDKLIDDLFKEIIAEAPGGRLACTAHRHPTLMFCSNMLMYIIRVKTDYRDETISISDQVTSQPNADFDGDQMHISIVPSLDHELLRAARSLAPHNSVFLPSVPGVLSQHMKLPPVAAMTMSNYLSKQPVGEPNVNILDYMEAV